MKRHLDIGCGKRPRNPYGASEVHGVDIYQPPRDEKTNPNYRSANLILETIPYSDGFFDSISAFDFIEHIPRILPTPDNSIRFPFIELMNEVWRTLNHGGLFYAITPAYPAPEAFQDPTHVNIITEETHHYFCRDHLYSRNYGFTGKFEAVECRWVYPRLHLTAERTLGKHLRSLKKSLIKRQQKTHLLWQLRADKSAG
jgi:SAM-dependent methyltransferase